MTKKKYIKLTKAQKLENKLKENPNYIPKGCVRITIFNDYLDLN